MNIEKDNYLKAFNSFVIAKKNQVLYLKLFYLSATIIVIAAFYYSYSLASKAMDKVLVVSTGGEFLPLKSMELETLYMTLLTTHCYSVAYYANSFNVNNIKNNQARAAFLVNQADLNAIFGKYQYDKAYSDVINKGVIYSCEFKKMKNVVSKGNGSEYQVVFTSVLSVTDNSGTTQFEILSRGTAVRVTPRYPENPTGFYFKNYTQEYSKIIKVE